MFGNDDQRIVTVPLGMNVFKLQFGLKELTYDSKKQYYLMFCNDKNDVEMARYEAVIDIAFSNNFGF
ncbi:MAG: hypothetical protein ABFD50_08900 [Smithella sp.]